MGDLYINWMNPSESRHLKRITEGMGIRQVVNRPTRKHAVGKHLLPYKQQERNLQARGM